MRFWSGASHRHVILRFEGKNQSRSMRIIKRMRNRSGEGSGDDWSMIFYEVFDACLSFMNQAISSVRWIGSLDRLTKVEEESLFPVLLP
jgi:hypothetical protein